MEYDSNLRPVTEYNNQSSDTGAKTVTTYDLRDRVTNKKTYNTSNTLMYEENYAYTDIVGTELMSKAAKTIEGQTGAPDTVTVEYYDKYGRKIKDGSVKNGTEYLNTYTLDYKGRTVSTKTARHTDEAWTEPVTESVAYDFRDNVVSDTNISGDTSSTTYDMLGRKTSTTDLKGQTTTYEYDNLSNLLKTSTPFETVDSNTVYSVTKDYYDLNGNVAATKTTDNEAGGTASWKTTNYGYNSRNMLTSAVLDGGAEGAQYTQYYYDTTGNTLRMYTGQTSLLTISGLDQVSGGSGYATTKYTYDRFGNLTQYTDPLNQRETYEYDLNGKIDEKTDRNGSVTVYTYNALGNALSESVTNSLYPSYNASKSYTYYCTGALASDAMGSVTTAYEYDGMGKLTKETQTGGYNLNYTYDAGGNRTNLTIKDGGNNTINSTDYEYDKLNRLTNADAGTVEADYTYDDNGNRATMSYNNGNNVVYDYNLANLVTDLTNKQGMTNLSDYGYGYQLDGNQVSENESVANKTTTYQYDYAARLKNETEGSDGTQYTYDSFGNRATMTKPDGTVVTYEYDLDNRLTTETSVLGQDETVTTYLYDANGNMISKTVGQNTVTYTYDGFNEMKSCGGESYTYRANGLRYSKSDGNSTTIHIWDGQNIALDITGTNVVKYIRGINLIAKDDGTNISYYLYNAHGDVVALTDGTGAVTKAYTYDAFGNEVNPSAGDTNPFRYCGEYFDKETGTIYLRARYYDPEIGRFTSEDSVKVTSFKLPNDANVVDPLSLNLYTYCGNNPIIYGDPGGHYWMLIPIIIGLIVLLSGCSTKSGQKAAATPTTKPSATPSPTPTPRPTPKYGGMSVSYNLVVFIASYESYRKMPYTGQDSQNRTVGYGHVITESDGNKYDNGISQADAMELLRSDLTIAINKVNQFSINNSVLFTQNQFDALVSFTFNVGSYWMDDTSLSKALISGNFKDVRKAMMKWIYVNGKKSLGLYRRRSDEVSIFYNSEYKRDYPDMN